MAGGGGKIKLLRLGAYADHGVNISLISHPGTVPDAALVRTTAYSRQEAIYHGRAAHAAAAPWDGINALDALVTAYSALGLLRQQCRPGDLLQAQITDGGAAPNVIHARAAGVFVTRAPTRARLRCLRQRVQGCLAAGAEAAGARLEVVEQGAYADHVPNRVLGRAYTRWWNALGLGKEREIPGEADLDEEKGRSGASTDQGDISYAMPSLCVGFRIPGGPGGGGPHSPEFAKAAGTREAFCMALDVAKALAATAVDVLTAEGMLKEVQEAWERDMRDGEDSGPSLQ